MSKLSTSIIQLCGINTNGELQLENNLLGKKVINVFGNNSKLVAITEIGAIDIITHQKVSDSRYVSMSFGELHNLGLTSHGILYSWGNGEYGELGLGSKIIKSELPTEIKVENKIVDISCGLYHSCACDIKGNMYSWGQNFDRQLGLYKKTKEQMNYAHIENCYIEDIILIPRFLPFSAEKHIIKVSCGSKFTAAITTVHFYFFFNINIYILIQ